ncbi:MAG: hypothetical protein ACUVQ5_04425 [Candidatus Methanomethylicaceae archaeon]
MEQAITRILIAAAIVALVSYAATYAPLIINRDLGTETLKEKAVELGESIIEKDPKVIYGISTGSKTMSAIKIGQNNITVTLVGDRINIYVPRNALFVKGIQFASPPSTEVSNSTSDTLMFYSTSDGFYIQPKVMILPPVKTSDISNITLHLLSIRTCYLSDILISGLFDLLKECVVVNRHLYERVCLYDGLVDVSVNGHSYFQFEIKKGEKLLIESLHYNVKLIPMPRG